MKPDNWNRFAAGLLAILLCLCSFSMPAFASGSDPAPEPLPEIIEEEPTTGGMEPEGVSITPKGNATLVDDFYGDKQLITVTTKAGNYFYILIDRANEDKETSVHFLNQVDDADLLALLDEEPQDTEFCICTVKCEAGNVNENCPLCEKSLRNCTAPEAVKTDIETPQEKPKSNMGSLMILLVLVLAGGGAALYYFKFRKPKADCPCKAARHRPRRPGTGQPPGQPHPRGAGRKRSLCSLPALRAGHIRVFLWLCGRVEFGPGTGRVESLSGNYPQCGP